MSGVPGDWCVVYRLRFTDGAEPEYGCLTTGTRDDCDRLVRLVPAIAYSGPRPVDRADIGVFQLPYRSEGGGSDDKTG